MSDEMHISRSLASQYLNELVKEKVVMKINSRPVYFLHRKKMEELYKTTFQDDDFYDLEEVKQYVMNHSFGEGNYSKIIGSDKSLAIVIKQLRESFEYPPCGSVSYTHLDVYKRQSLALMSIFIQRVILIMKFKE